MKLKLIFIAVATVLLGGCAVTQQEREHANYGPPPLEYKTAITNWCNADLRDPYTAHIQIGYPEQFIMHDSLVNGFKTYAGWMVKAAINSKNGFGAYTGIQTYGFIFHDESIIRVIEPDEWENFH